jgi:hypothetical protein
VKKKRLTKETKTSKKKAFSCHPERRKTKRKEMEAANIVLTADGGMGETYSNDAATYRGAEHFGNVIKRGIAKRGCS